jgi:hypothetical protein
MNWSDVMAGEVLPANEYEALQLSRQFQRILSRH